MDTITDVLAHHGLAAPERDIALSGTIRTKGDASVKPHLILVDRDVRLVGVDKKGGDALYVDVLAAKPLRFESKRFGDELVVGKHRLSIPLRRGDAVKQLLATARLRRGEGAISGVRVLDGRYVDDFRAVDALWLGKFLAPDEPLLAWLETATKVTLDSPVLGKVDVPWFFYMTTERSGLVALSEVGDVRVERFPPGAAMKVRSSLGRTEVRMGGICWRAGRKHADAFRALEPLVRQGAAGRALGLAGQCLRAGKGSAASRREAERLLRLPAAFEHPLSVLARQLVLADGAPVFDEQVDAALAALAKESPDGAVLAAWSDDWPLDQGVALGLLGRMLDMAERAPEGAEERALVSWSLPFHRALHRRRMAAVEGDLERAEIDLALAEHLDAAAAWSELIALIDTRLATLPAPELADLLPPTRAEEADDDMPGHTVRARLYALLAHALEARAEVLADSDPGAKARARALRAVSLKAPAVSRQLEALRTLAMLEPLVPSHLDHLSELASGTLADTAREARAVLERGGLAPVEAEEATGQGPGAPVGALPPQVVEDVIQHPATRGNGVLSRLQNLLARVEHPDRSVLTSYCERLDSGAHADVLTDLRDAAMALGTPGIDGYLSRGDKSIGARAYEGRPPFLLLGVRHVDGSSDLHMRPSELRFLIATEVAHLRFGHTRLTSEDVWTGAWQTGKAGLDLLFTALPMLRGVKLVDRLHGLLDMYRMPVVGKVIERATTTLVERRRGGEPEEVNIAPAYEQLLVAHRAMQLTADRAGLLLCRDLRSAIRAIFLSRTEYRAELPLAEHYGLVEALMRSGQRGEVLYQNLAIRIAALISFSLSPAYREAEAALYGAGKRAS
ncbi:hypothetical protein [Haliangium ochraceum]|uniref:Uncharacterized protein n=1 Tax=Haliangium ochraceum (strain DSM 14365 / JCM 11303 / SMP-2) TaxID=502025 RepID=D0LPY0_HALO1|nr:hypothetical protein [Haliangium ochraceum]ACY17017.1 hypothetical protein Hoch_4524 [Haliangium ochraceum DSM 14365]